MRLSQFSWQRRIVGDNRKLGQVTKLPAPETITQVWYHANCADGFGAAWSAWKILGDRAEYHPVRHGDPMPGYSPETRLAIVDFAYPREQLLDLKEKVEALIVLDHHRSAAEDLKGLDFAHFEMCKSGARMA